MTDITPREIDLFCKYIFDISGIYLDKTKAYLLQTRLQPILAGNNLRSFADLYNKSRSDPSEKLKIEIIDAISTNETFFFRDTVPFDLLRNKIIPDLIDRREHFIKGNKKIPIRIWSAASSTGQEVYSIAITLLEMLPNLNQFDINILGTDISDKAIAAASYGKYNQFEIERGLDPHMRQKYFTRVAGGWRIKDEVRFMVRLQKFNLMQSFDTIGRFDIVFCRNVAIYFTQDNKVKLFRKIARTLEPEGALIVGGSESLGSIASDFQAHHYLHGIYYTLKKAPIRTKAPAPSPPEKPLQWEPPAALTTARTAANSIAGRPTAPTAPGGRQTPLPGRKQPTVPFAPPENTTRAGYPAIKPSVPMALTRPRPEPATPPPAAPVTESPPRKSSLLASLANRQKTETPSMAAARNRQKEQKESLLARLQQKKKKKGDEDGKS